MSSLLRVMCVATVLVLSMISSCMQAGKSSAHEIYKCIPCGYDCDTVSHTGPGTCATCKMELVKASSITFKTIQPNAICDYVAKHPEVILLDVRSKEEFEGNAEPNFGTLKNAINIPIQELEKQKATIEKYKQKEIIVFCSHSHRSPQASYHLTQNGFTNITNMAGGMSVLDKGDCIRK
jgi:rhodanese-related sulfurtransferase